MDKTNYNKLSIDSIKCKVHEIIRNDLHYKYYQSNNEPIFFDPRIKVRDVLYILILVCNYYGIEINRIRPFSNEITIDSISEQIYSIINEED